MNRRSFFRTLARSVMTSAALLLGEEFGPLRLVGAALVLIGLGFGTVRLRAVFA